MSTQDLRIASADAVRWIRLDRPGRRNALSPELVASLRRAVDAAEADEQVRAVVIAGQGPSFCAGADLSVMLAFAESGASPIAFLTEVWDCFAAIERLPVPVVAAVHGHAVAGGLELALACDAVLAATGAVLGDGHVRNGLLPGGGASYRLPRKVGEPLARRLVLTGELMGAERFVASGFVSTVVPAADLEAAASDLALRLSAGGREVTARAKRLLAPRELEAAREWELDAFAGNWQPDVIADRLRRFLERRK